MTQEQAFAILNSGQNVFVTGAAGSGKTYLLNRFIAHLRRRGGTVAVTASTGIAATHIGGVTIHSWAGMGIERLMSDEKVKVVAANKRVAKRLTKTDTLVIDEISMLDADRLDLVDRIARATRGNKRPFGGMQVIFCGDFFNSHRWLERMRRRLNLLIGPLHGKRRVPEFAISRNVLGTTIISFCQSLTLSAALLPTLQHMLFLEVV